MNESASRKFYGKSARIIIFALIIIGSIWSYFAFVVDDDNSERLWAIASLPYGVADRNRYFCLLELYPDLGIVYLPVSNCPETLDREKSLIKRAIQEARVHFHRQFMENRLRTFGDVRGERKEVPFRPTQIVFMFPNKRPSDDSGVAYLFNANDVLGAVDIGKCMIGGCRSEGGWTAASVGDSTRTFVFPVLQKCKDAKAKE
ncbi:hypothetical protein [Schlesneria paludicola]|uniref:hypothetical protein n=1 Tax=Schlesneria paludicola TaxID=360056 RepID=UPI00029A468B|nr:hypothetical protein [Schlesneria paludicola]